MKHSDLALLKKACLEKVENAFVMAEKHYKTTINRVPVKFCERKSTCAGTAAYSRVGGVLRGSYITLATKLLALNGEEFIGRTPGHEAAHIIAIELFGDLGRGHGPRWKEVMRVIGQDASRLHNMKTTKRQFEYKAENGVVIRVSASVHARLQAGAVYYTKRGKSPIRASGFVTTNATTAPVLLVAAEEQTPAPVTATKIHTTFKVPKASNGSKAEIVRAFLKENSKLPVNVIVDYAFSLGFKTRAAAKNCVVDNMKKLGM